MNGQLFETAADDGLLPVISLWQPWAQWVMLGWKKIETRTHNRFRGLAGKRIGIHATEKWDKTAISAAYPWLVSSQIAKTDALRSEGGLLGTVQVSSYRELHGDDSPLALIDCKTVKRYGLFLDAIETRLVALPVKGQRGIWYIKP